MCVCVCCVVCVRACYMTQEGHCFSFRTHNKLFALIITLSLLILCTQVYMRTKGTSNEVITINKVRISLSKNKKISVVHLRQGVFLFSGYRLGFVMLSQILDNFSGRYIFGALEGWGSKYPAGGWSSPKRETGKFQYEHLYGT